MVSPYINWIRFNSIILTSWSKWCIIVVIKDCLHQVRVRYIFIHMKGLCWLHAVCCSIISSSWQKCAAGMAIIAHTSQPAPLSLLFMNLCISNFLWRKIKAVTQRAGQMRKRELLRYEAKWESHSLHCVVLPIISHNKSVFLGGSASVTLVCKLDVKSELWERVEVHDQSHYECIA